LVWDFVTTVVPLKERGDSVALNFLQIYQASPNPPFRITRQFLTNANMFLPLANLTEFQKAMLDPNTSATAVKNMTAERLAVGVGSNLYSPPLKPDDPEVRALAFNFAWQDGIAAIPATIQYLNEGLKFEVGFLETLSRSSVPATLMWGLHDTVSPVRVGNYVWETVLKPRKAVASYWLLPCANHYLVHDRPQDIPQIMRLALGNELPSKPQNLTTDVWGSGATEQGRPASRN